MIVKETTSTKSPIYEDALSIRHEVFITEQNVPFEREIEGAEGKQYFVATSERLPPSAPELFWNLREFGTFSASHAVRNIAASILRAN